MSWQETPQQAIEDYLEALLSDDEFEEEQSISYSPQGEQIEESVQARRLSASMLQAQQAPKAVSVEPTRLTQFDEPTPEPQVILPDLKLPKTETVVETLADVVQKIEATPLVEEQLEIPEQPVEIPVAVEAEPEAETPAAGQPPSPPGWKDGRPAWAQERFECLLFKVKGLTLAVPLVELGGIIKIEKQPTPLFGQPSWFIGMLRNNNMNVSMVDTAQWVLPPALVEKNTDPYQLIIRIHNSRWGLACNEVDRSISLEPEQVRWRTSLGKRPWLAGTVIEHMCALIDAAAFGRLLKEGHGDLEPANLSELNKLHDE